MAVAGFASLFPCLTPPSSVCCMLIGVSHLFYDVLNTFLPNVVLFSAGKGKNLWCPGSSFLSDLC